MRTLLPAVLVALALPALRLPGQTIAGRIVQGAVRAPARRAAVALVDDSARVVARAQADTEGVFYADAPAPGRYRVVFFLAAGSSSVSPPFQLDSGDFVQREFTIPEVPAALTNVLFPADVTHPATSLPGNPMPEYPSALQARGVRGLVSAFFVVSEDGTPEMETFQVLTTSDRAFVQSVRDAVRRSRFNAADLDGHKVAQVMQISFDFGLPGDPPRGDIVIRTLAAHGG